MDIQIATAVINAGVLIIGGGIWSAVKNVLREIKGIKETSIRHNETLITHGEEIKEIRKICYSKLQANGR